MENFNIKKDREKLSDQEIKNQMNFNKFISGYTPSLPWYAKGVKLYTSIVSASVIIGIAGYVLFSSINKEKNKNATPFINPPIAALNTVFEKFNYTCNSDTTFACSSGTILKIPSSAFVDEVGKEVSGDVQLDFREFHDQVDIFLSGIPMSYDSAKENYDFESAGMFEINASQNGKPLKLNPNKTITIDMVSNVNNNSDFNIYYLDTLKKKWNYISENTSSNNTCFPVFEKSFNEKSKSGHESLVEQIQPIKPKKLNTTNYNFVIDFKKAEFPELSVYNELKFEPLEHKKEFHTKLAEKTWNDVIIKRDTNSSYYVITFLADNESQSISAVPVVDEKNYEKAMAIFEQQQKKYEQFLKQKKASMAAKKDSLYRINTIYTSLAQKSNLNERLENFINNSFTETTKDLLVYRTFVISKLGIWNSDKPIHFNGAGKKEYMAQFFSKEDKPIILKRVTLINRKVNGLANLSDKSFNHFPLGMNIDIIIGIDYENKAYYIKDDELRKVDLSNDVVKIRLNSTENLSKPEDLKALLKI